MAFLELEHHINIFFRPFFFNSISQNDSYESTAVLETWASWQKMLLDLFSSIYFLFSFNFIKRFLWSKNKIMWWFGGNWSINGRYLAIFMPYFGRYWSVVLMTFRPSFFNLLIFCFNFIEWLLLIKKDIWCYGISQEFL